MKRLRPTLVVFQGGASDSASALERLVSDAQRAATLDLLTTATAGDAFDSVIFYTDDAQFGATAFTESSGGSVELKVERALDGPFHFGETLRAICRTNKLERVVYLGGSSFPLGTERDLGDLALAMAGPGHAVVANSLYSADMVAFNPASALDRIPLPTHDNDLAWLLHFHAGLPFAPMPRTLANSFDIDTPSDLAVLRWCAQAPPLKGTPGLHLGRVLSRVSEAMPSLTHNIERAYRVMATRRAEVLVAGRVSSWVWRRLETNLPCQTRIVSEERGMRASGREERGEARSLLGLLNDAAGTDGLIRALEQVCDAAFLDSRVLFAHRRLKPITTDRFASDALIPNLIADPYVRELTEAAGSAAIPIVLGGHSLISGGLWALSERVRASASAPTSQPDQEPTP